MTGAEIEKMIRFAFSFRFNGAGEEAFQRSKGVSITYNKTKDEVERILFHEQALDPEKIYAVGLQQFQFDNAMQNLGFDPQKLQSGKKPNVICTNDFDILEEYFLTHQNIDAEIEGRILFVG